MQRPEKIENVKKKNPCQSEEDALAWDKQLCLSQWQGTRIGWRQPLESHRRRWGSRRASDTPQGTWLGGALKGNLWLCCAGSLAGKQKIEIQVIGEDQSRFPWRGTVGEVRREGRRASNSVKKRVHILRVRFGRERKTSRLPFLSFGIGDDRRSTSGSGDISLAIFITSVSGSKSLISGVPKLFLLTAPFENLSIFAAP